MSPQIFKPLCVFGFEPWCSEDNPPILPLPFLPHKEVKAPHANPVLNRNESGVRIYTPAASALLSPGSYEAKVGNGLEALCVVTSVTAGKVKTVVLINGSIARTWEDEISPDKVLYRNYYIPSAEAGTYEISMATYYWDGSQYVKNDEYGTWVITVGEMPAGQANPVIDRSRSGLRIAGGSLLSPGSYEANVGDNLEFDCYVTSETARKMATAVIVNGIKELFLEDEIEAGGSVSHTQTGTLTYKGTYEISMATYYWDGSQYVKSDEYGTWVITVT